MIAQMLSEVDLIQQYSAVFSRGTYQVASLRYSSVVSTKPCNYCTQWLQFWTHEAEVLWPLRQNVAIFTVIIMDSKYSGFWLIGAAIYLGQIENITRICFPFWDTMPFSWASICHMAHL
jgi:hypothetical protein